MPSLPHFTEDQKHQLKSSVDYFALNHYTTTWVSASHEGPKSALPAGACASNTFNEVDM